MGTTEAQELYKRMFEISKELENREVTYLQGATDEDIHALFEEWLRLSGIMSNVLFNGIADRRIKAW